MRPVATIVLGLLLTGLGLSTAHAQSASPAKRDRSDLHYEIVHDSLRNNGRLVIVLMDEKSFSETNLKALFAIVSKRFVEPAELHMAVFTNLEQIATTDEELDNSPASGHSKSNPNFERYPSAVYLRNQGNESFSYRTPAQHGVEKTVILKGQDLLHPKKKQPRSVNEEVVKAANYLRRNNTPCLPKNYTAFCC